MRRFTAFAIVGMFIAAAPAFAQSAGTRTADENPRARVEAPARGCGFLGIYPHDISRRTAEKLGLGDRKGAIVAGIVKETGAERAGIREKDVIIALNGESITSEAQLRRLIISQTPGTVVRIDLVRDGSAMVVNAEISSRVKYYGGPDCNAQRHENDRNQEQLEQRRRDAVRDLDIGSLEMQRFEDEMRSAERELEAARNQLRHSVTEVRTQRNNVNGYESNTGLGLQRMSPQLAKFFQTPSSSGALVNEVAEGSPALRAGMQAGDVIVGVNGQSVKGPMDAVKAIVQDGDGTVELRIIRDGQERTVEIRIGATDRTTPRNAPNTQPELGSLHDLK